MSLSKTSLYDLCVLIPTLNEEKTIGNLIKKIKDEIKVINKKICIVISDNGSTDKTVSIAKKHNVIINQVGLKGYGSNLINAINKIKSKYTIYFDADGSYSPKEIKLFIEEFDNKPNLDFVSGNRLDKVESGAMPFLNRYFGTPFLSFIISYFFKKKIRDCNSGMRMFVTSKVKKLKLKCSGMEFASEFFIKAFVNGLQFNEIKISLKKDKRSSPPHLRRWVDGWRHLRFIYANAPDFFVVVPFILILFIYVYAFVLSYYSIENILSLPRYHTIFSLIALNQFFALIMIGILSIKISLHSQGRTCSRMAALILDLDHKGYFLRFFIIFLVLSIIELSYILLNWYNASFGPINEMDNIIRIIIYSSFSSIGLLVNLITDSKV